MAKIVSLVTLLTVFSFTFFPADHRSSSAKVAELAHIATDSVNAKAIATLNQIIMLLINATNPNRKQALQDYVDNHYSIIKASIRIAIDAIVKGNPKFAVTSATDAANEAQSCGNGFANPFKSPITYSNKVVYNLSFVLKSIASLLL
ncbi:hypothetical protein PTKIN_Ptkin10aG0005600 [Pterospermum kingtungense]